MDIVIGLDIDTFADKLWVQSLSNKSAIFYEK